MKKEFRKGVQRFVSDGETIPLMEKVRTWRTSNHVSPRQWEDRKKNRDGEHDTEKDGRKRIDQVEFEGGIPETKSIIKDVKDSFEEIVPKVYIPPSCVVFQKKFKNTLSSLFALLRFPFDSSTLNHPPLYFSFHLTLRVIFTPSSLNFLAS